MKMKTISIFGPEENRKATALMTFGLSQNAARCMVALDEALHTADEISRLTGMPQPYVSAALHEIGAKSRNQPKTGKCGKPPLMWRLPDHYQDMVAEFRDRMIATANKAYNEATQ